ncbi:putative cell division protein kinase [Cucumispora dikerogammari]|nr:putative cell division protein kinase [Cucumispora dikerogammari]
MVRSNRYEIIKQLGEGTYATVYQVYDDFNKELVAVKCVDLDQNHGIPTTTLREISILKSLNHPNILKYKHVIIGPTQVCLITEFVDFELGAFIRSFRYNTEDIFKQLVIGLSYLHRSHIIHRDLKPQNILVNKNGRIKIADFGLSVSTKLRIPVFSSDVVTLWYRSPELLSGTRIYSFEIDMWSFGCVMLEVMLGEPFFMGNNEIEMLKLISEFEENKDQWQKILDDINIPKYLSWSVLMCLNRDTRKRVTAVFLENKYIFV